MIKANKIMTCVSQNALERQNMLATVAMQCGFAMIRSDAKKLIAQTIDDINISTAYYILADNYDFRKSDSTNQRLFELAARGLAVIVGVRKLPSALEPFCTVYYPEQIL